MNSWWVQLTVYWHIGARAPCANCTSPCFAWVMDIIHPSARMFLKTVTGVTFWFASIFMRVIFGALREAKVKFQFCLFGIPEQTRSLYVSYSCFSGRLFFVPSDTIMQKKTAYSLNWETRTSWPGLLKIAFVEKWSIQLLLRSMTCVKKLIENGKCTEPIASALLGVTGYVNICT